MKTLIVSIILLGTLSLLKGQESLPYSTGFDSDSERMGWREFRLGKATDPTYKWKYSTSDPKSSPNSLIHNYPVGGEDTTNDWFVSPAIDFSAGGTVDSLWYSFSGFGTPAEGDTIAVYLLEGNQNPALSDAKTRLVLFEDSLYQNDDSFRYLSGLTIPNTNKKAHIAFQYRTVVNWLDVKFDNIYISNETSSQNKLTANRQLKVYPNPANKRISFEFPEENKVFNYKLQTLKGKQVKSGTLHSVKPTLNIDQLNPGIYLLKVWNSGEAIHKKVFIH